MPNKYRTRGANNLFSKILSTFGCLMIFIAEAIAMNRAPIPKISIGINRDRVRNMEARTINRKMMVMIPVIMFSTFYPGFPPGSALFRRKFYFVWHLDDLLKSRHSGENRSPVNLWTFEKTGFQLPAFAGTSFAGMTEKHTFGLLTSSSHLNSFQFFSMPPWVL